MLRNALFALGPASLAIAALFACEDSSSGGGGVVAAGTLDAGTATPSPQSDGATIPTDGQVTPAAVVVTVAGTTLTGISVVFHDASGAVLEKTTTGADGKATSTVAGVAMVTAFNSRDTERHAVTWTNVAAGDVLALRDLPSAVPPGTYTFASGAITAAPSGRGTSYTAYAGPCSSTTTVSSLPTSIDIVSYRCVGTTPSALLIYGSSSITATPSSYFAFTKAGPAAPANGSAVAATIDANWIAPSTTQITVANNTATTETLRAGLSSIGGGLLFTPFPPQTVADAPLSFSYPTNFGDLQAVLIASASGVTRSLSRRYTAAGAVTLDYAQLLGTLGVPSIDATDGARPAVSWTGDSTTADGGLVTFSFALAGDTTNTYSWSFVVPPGVNSVKAPALPPEFVFAPAADAGAASFGRILVEFVEADAFADAASFRQMQGAVFGQFAPTSLPFVPALPAIGQLRTTSSASSLR